MVKRRADVLDALEACKRESPTNSDHAILSLLVGLLGLMRCGEGGGQPLPNEIVAAAYLRTGSAEEWRWFCEQLIAHFKRAAPGHLDSLVMSLLNGADQHTVRLCYRDAPHAGFGHRIALWQIAQDLIMFLGRSAA
jgi:hypothetical protein